MSPPNNNHGNKCSNKKSGGGDEYSLRWNDWIESVQEQLRLIKKETTFADLKVVTEDGGVFHAHKVVLASSSLVLEGVLKETPEGETLILHEIRSAEFEAILDFVYDGQVNISQDDLPKFFSAAQSLGVKGLVSSGQQQKEEDSSILVKALLSKRARYDDAAADPNAAAIAAGGGGGSDSEDSNFPSDSEEEEDCEKNKRHLIRSNLLDESNNSSSSASRIRATDPRPCPKCGKIYRSAHTLRTHLEDKHTICPGYRCVLCGTVAKSRNSLHSHMSRQHRGISTKDLPVLPMPAPFDPELARRLLTGQSGQQGSQQQQQQQQQFYGSTPVGSLGAGSSSSSAIASAAAAAAAAACAATTSKNNNFNSAASDSSSGEASTTGSAILDTYLQFIAENTLFK